ncbi:Eukaryotic aspartyl protease family protein [Striga hermonthica]|uniref:Eukaryotic aspartyl protease family protein n=1 Tax=Striga hermonthica TaxID=68872 RepID=A0A9N7NCI5_STRHE|nr:Eukaryotic aspartyl protease family protein [Striga hermonthica]
MYLKALVWCLSAWIASAAPSKSVVFPVKGDVYPRGLYTAAVTLGATKKTYLLDIDTGSDLTWVQCNVPSAKNHRAPNAPYTPVPAQVIPAANPMCNALQPISGIKKPPNPKRCDYLIKYADGSSTQGMLISDTVNVQFTNRTVAPLPFVFGCGYNQISGSNPPPNADGILGLGKGKTTILAQLGQMGVTRNVVAHCFSSNGGGSLFLGELPPTQGVVWMPLLTKSANYYLGKAALVFGAQTANDMNGLDIILDSGSTYTYLASKPYKALLSLINGYLNGKPLAPVKDAALPVCWKSSTGKTFKSVTDVAANFQSLTLSFPNNVKFQMDPTSYLIVTTSGNVCLGILNGDEIGLKNQNLIGDISFLDKLVIYDNENGKVGWVNVKCPSNKN